ncbi:polysaccharide deacetylase family protein [Agrobacterium sp. SHOUNA12C]|uniref:Chitooligosaccharide deacetylase n=2 Tax=Rhizobium rhizogenes TaxID=359 RepID=B9JBI2_RHIR8|nr:MULTISPECIES: polysaccharide deacetylase family protein [Rhizobium]ACM25888.1 polysaccharide deacetylase protein [Rhizobium rhizogenes K84]KAA6491271.1 polysaccharide deacetylase [Agrobacterium sp. ICMP 7243]MCJ9722856.1 polysaccharide deacetylase family protein [Agrobacterium sp. BETTINA12B]MCJ9760531.1 polysaccharide deacetylase family protein [Agrobacterium sp. SHOUNA12C]OCJ02889.1 polysaccharide deacetylase [Agrobacterium sp. 13-626]OCJ25006.1 polysaccharide deacetylase [Agrobacterium 
MNRFLLTSAFLLAAVPAAFAAKQETPPAGWPPLPPKASASNVKLVEPHLHVNRAGKGAPRIALTFDACMGKTDPRILSTLVDQRIPSTIFVTARWLRTNPDALATFLAHPDLFELENHGQNHIPAVDIPTKVYGIAAAGSPQAVAQEVKGGADAMLAAGIPQPRWFRGATAKYSLSAIAQIRGMGYRIAGYSVNGDSGSLLPAKMVEKQYASARDGDVIISHINQPTHAAGEGVAASILALKAKGVQFVRLQDIPEQGDDDTTN